MGGMQLPCVVEMAAHAFFSKAGIGVGGGGMLTSGNANLLMAHGTARSKRGVRANEFAGRWFGTMCLSGAAGRLQPVDIVTPAPTARPESDPLGPQLPPARQQDVDQAASTSWPENIVHLVLAKIPGRTAGWCRAPGASRCSSCPRSWSTPRAAHRRAQRRGAGRPEPQARLARHPNTLLNFGEGVPGATRRARWATSSASRAKACAACST